MRCSETITALGTGTWDTLYDLSLATVRRVYNELYGNLEISVITYELRFKRPSTPDWDRRMFDTEMERDNFLSSSFSSINLAKPPAKPKPEDCPNQLIQIVGEYLSSVTFVMDYLQIDFSGYTFNYYVWPIVTTDRGKFVNGDSRYRDELCSLIAKHVISADEYLDAGIVIEFEAGSSLQVPLRVRDDFALPEVAEYHGPGGIGKIWLAGERPYA